MAFKFEKPASISRAVSVSKEVDAQIEKTEMIELSKIVFNEDNIFGKEDSDESIQELADNIKANGLIHNIAVRRLGDGRYKLISGERRVKAYRLLGKETIKANVLVINSWLDEFNALCDANTQTRNYTAQQRDMIISAIKEKLEEYSDNNPNEKVDVATIADLTAKRFAVTKSTAYKFVGIHNELIQPLKDLYFSNDISLDNASAFSSLPEVAQNKIAEMYAENAEDAKENAAKYAKSVKAVIDKDDKQLQKNKWAKAYAEKKAAEAEKNCDDKLKAKYEARLNEIAANEKAILDNQSKEINSIKIVAEPKNNKKQNPEDIVGECIERIRKAIAKISKTGICDDDVLEDMMRLLDKL